MESGRYVLYVCLACPWAHRSIIVRSLLGLEDAIALRVVDPIRDEQGWRFTLDEGGTESTARDSRPSSVSALGATQMGVRWYTSRWATSAAISGMT